MYFCAVFCEQHSSRVFTLFLKIQKKTFLDSLTFTFFEESFKKSKNVIQKS